MARRKIKSSNKVETVAIGIGAALGKVAGRADALKRQRAEVAAELRDVIKVAQGMLVELGGEAKSTGKRVRTTVGKAATQVAQAHARRRTAVAKRRAAKKGAAKKRSAKKR